jgi:hypothetical protein
MIRSFILGATAWLVIVTVASAGSPGSSLLSPTAAGASRPVTRPKSPVNPCASYGANFVRLEGTDTCVKVGGAVRVETGAASGR